MGFIGRFVTVLPDAAVWWKRARRAPLDDGGSSRDLLRASRRNARHSPTLRFARKRPARIENAGAATAVLLYRLAALKGAVDRKTEAAICDRLGSVCDMSETDCAEALRVAHEVGGLVPDTDTLMCRLLPLWAGTLKTEEKAALTDMARAVAEIDGPPTDEQRALVRRLETGLIGVGRP
ncbi:MAG: hypothetical protein R3C52_03360 [Hyphomonadaceae bacterium]